MRVDVAMPTNDKTCEHRLRCGLGACVVRQICQVYHHWLRERGFSHCKDCGIMLLPVQLFHICNSATAPGCRRVLVFCAGLTLNYRPEGSTKRGAVIVLRGR